jgi:hypothetical protein
MPLAHILLARKRNLRAEVVMPNPEFSETSSTRANVPIRDLGLRIAGTPLERIIADFQKELGDAGIRRLRPHFYLSTEWGVPFDTISIAVPFYLARADLTALQAERHGHVEGTGRDDILRYLRHEMGHVVNYAYQLYEQPEWVELFGSITQSYEEEYRPEPFSRRFVRHLPGWYAQKHPDEDWAETFAVWLTPGRDWRAEYGDSPEALAKLEFCESTMKAVAERDPPVAATELDEDVGDLTYTLDHFYGTETPRAEPMPRGLDGALRTIFEPMLGESEVPASELLRKLEPELMDSVYRWTGHFPERTRGLVRYLGERADGLRLGYDAGRELAASVALTALVSALAVNHVHRGTYLPS